MLRLNKISPKKPCPFCGAFLENDQIAQWDTRFDAKGKKVLDDAE